MSRSASFFMTTTPRTELNPIAFAVSLGFHIAIFFILPFHQEPIPSSPLRMEVQLSQLTKAEPATAAPEPPPEVVTQPPQPQPQPVAEVPKPQKQKPTPILSAQKSEASPVVPQALEVPQVAEETAVSEPKIIEPVPAEPSAESAQEEVAAVSPSTAAVSNTAQSQEMSESEAWDGYGLLLYDLVERNKKYPQIAIRRHLEGRVIISARFSMGKLIDVTLVDSSGHKVLDEQALEMVKKAVDILPMKNGLAEKTFDVVVPIDFKLQT